MVSKDLGPARDAEAPLRAVEELSRPTLIKFGKRLAKRTWADGLSRWFWPEGVALIGLGDFGVAAASGDDIVVRDWITRQIADQPHVDHVNDLPPAAAAISVGIEAAKIRPYGEWIATAPRSAAGAIEHWPGGLWADTMYMAGVLLARLGGASGSPELIEAALSQYLLHAKVIQDERTGLFAHGSHRGETIWNFWGRANAWAALAAVEILEASEVFGPGNFPGAVEVRERLSLQLASLVRYQPDHGVWEVLVDGQPETKGIVETSAAAGLAAAMMRAKRATRGSIPESVSAAGERALRGVLAYVDDEGYLKRVSAGTILQLLPFGYAVIRTDRPQLWGQGLALEAIAAALSTLPELDGAQQ